MTKNNKAKKNNFDFPEPTDKEIELLQKKMADEHSIDMPRSDLIKVVNLTKELGWWLTHKSKPDSPRHITEEMAIEFKDLLKKVRGIDIPVAEAYDEARSLLVITEYKEKERISKEIRAIMINHAPIPFNQDVQSRLIKLFTLQYGVELTRGQADQVVQFLTRNLWYEEGFGASLEKCLDDLLIYADKVKRGKRTNGINDHHKLRRLMDEAMGRLNIPSSDWERFYKES